MKVMDFCPCFSFCCQNSQSETGPLASSLHGPPHGTYTIRRISSEFVGPNRLRLINIFGGAVWVQTSKLRARDDRPRFGQTVIDEKGEECEIGRHCSIVQQTYNGNTGVPWSSKPTVIQPGLTDADLVERVRKMPTINEADLSLTTKQKSRWKKALSNVKKKEKSPKSEIQLKQVKELRKEMGQETSYSHDDILRVKRNSGHGGKGINNVRRSSYLMAVPPPITVSSPDLAICDGTSQRSFDTTISSVTIRTTDATDKVSPNSSSSWLKSQSMQDMNEGSETTGVVSERERLARLCGLDLALYEDTRTNIKKSNEALNRSVNSAVDVTVPDCWQEEPAGTVDFTAHYDSHSKQLHVCVNKVEGLCGEGIKREEYSALMKLCILPGKKHVRISKQLDQSLNPTVKQTFSFSIRDVGEKILRISLYNSSWQGMYDAVGHALFFVEDAAEKPTTYQMKLYSQSTADPTPGMLQISYGYSGGIFNIAVVKVLKLLPQFRNCKVYIKVSYYNLSKKMKEKVSVVGSSEKEDCDTVVFNHCCKFKMEESVGERVRLVVSLKRRNDNYNVFKHDKTIGRVMFGPAHYYENGRKLTPWGRAVINKEQLCHSFRMYL